MSETLERRAAGNGHAAYGAAASLEAVDKRIDARSASLDFDHTVLAELIARRWKQDRPYFTLNERAREPWLQASWCRQPGRSALELHWSHHAPCTASADLLPPPQAVFESAA